MNDYIRMNFDSSLFFEIIEDYFTGKREGWFGGLDNFIEAVYMYVDL